MYQSIYGKCTSQWLLFYSQIGTTITTVHFRTFSSLQKEALSPFAIAPHHLSLTPSPQPRATTHLLSVSVDLPVLGFHVDGII